MRLKVFFTLICCIAACSSFGQDNGDLTQSRILFLLDRSSSMIQPWTGGREKYKVADELIERLMDSVMAVNDQVEFSLRVFGHQHTVQENDCTDTKNEVPFSKANRTRLQFRLEDIRPLGVTPIAFTLQEAAANDIKDENHNAYSIILITDGGESCGGDICDVMDKLLKSKIYFKPYILGLEADPALRKEYACVGNYLEVTKKGDISTAVTTIVDAFRPMLKITKRDYKQLQAISTTNIEKPRVAVHPAKADTVALQPLPVKPAPKPDTVAKVVIPKKTNIQVDVVEQRTPLAKLTRIAPTRMRKLFTSARVTVKFQEEDLIVPEIKQKDTIAVILNPPAAKLTRLKTTRMKRLATTVNLNDDNFQPIRLNVPVISITDTIVPPPAPRPQEPKVTRIKPTHIKSFGHVFMIEESIFPLVKLTPPVINIPDVKTNGDKPKPTGTTPKPKTTPKTGEYSVMHDDARETTLEVYLTNGRGKFYYTTPKVFLTDPATNKEFKHFYRTVDGSNNPDPVKNIPAGKYDLTIDGREDLLAHVDVLPNKKTLVYVIVKDYSLFFTYEGAPERPVKEFSAIVIQRNNNNGKVVNQKCTEKLVYEPGNYHIIINTLPEDVRNVDLDNMDAGGIVIPQPGFADFLAEGPAKSVTLFKELGDKFVSFHVVNLTDPEAKHLMIQPGKYQAHYQNGQTKFASTEKVIPFVITSNQTTPVFLK